MEREGPETTKVPRSSNALRGASHIVGASGLIRKSGNRSSEKDHAQSKT
jgi:hypothetical protein